MWQIIHKLFGWDYAHISHPVWGGSIRRVTEAANGSRMIRLREGVRVVLVGPLAVEGTLYGRWRVVPLTPGVTERSTPSL